MPRGRHRLAGRLIRAQRLIAITLPALLVAAVPVGLVAWPDGGDELTATSDPVLQQPERTPAVSRSGGRTPMTDSSLLPRPLKVDVTSEPPSPKATPEETATPEPTETPEPTPTREETPTQTPEPTVVGSRFVTVDLNVRTGPSEDAELVTVLALGTEVDITDVTDDGWVQIIYDDTPLWVSGNYLSETKPVEETEEPDETEDDSGGLSSAACESGSEVEDGLTPDAIAVHRAVCAEFPDVSSYGGLRASSGEHGEGRALDIMVSSSSLGDSIAEWVRANYSELGVSEVIWAQHIWTVQRSSEGWRWMEDRGSDTANHYDHVHVTVYGYSTD